MDQKIRPTGHTLDMVNIVILATCRFREIPDTVHIGRRQRAVGCPMEIRKVLLGHKYGDITTHYRAAELEELLYWIEKLVERGAIQIPTLAVLNRQNVG
ncbi:MAG: hypothetical protein AB2535_04485 [Candidatus Thiodiazotropha endolucinida]